jgi:hypothetical protein
LKCCDAQSFSCAPPMGVVPHDIHPVQNLIHLVILSLSFIIAECIHIIARVE